jgi:uncharacterized phiE125 gp8 family phage protein
MNPRLLDTLELPITLAQAKRNLRVDASDEDGEIERLIEAAAISCGAYMERSISLCSYALTLSEFSDAIALPNPPTVSVSSVKYTDADGNVQTLAPSAYRLDFSKEPNLLRPVTEWPAGRDVVITYEAGWGEDAPAHAKQAVLMTVAHWFENREAVSDKPKSEVPLSATYLMSQLRVYG